MDEWIDAARDRDSAFVANTDVVEDEGTHWTLFYLPRDESRRPYLFDSFGRTPTSMGRPLWRAYMDAVATRRPGGDGRWDMNTHRVQEPHTTACGPLCAMALFLLARDMDLPKTVVRQKDIDDFMDMI